MYYPLLAATTISTAVTASVSSTTYTTRPFNSAFILCKFLYGADGTTAKAWVQCSADQGTTWHDVCNFAFTTSAATKFFNLSGMTAVTTQGTVADGTTGDNTAVDGALTNVFRVKYTTTGTYSGVTSLAVHLFTRDTDA
ncbi:MAG: hypothetical protein WC455_25395 [Dehalococcoidia bacterium]|jgi:hypothetical protein